MEEEWSRLREDGYFKNADGGQNHFISYVLPDAKADVVISHGFGETAEKYDEVVENFLKEGYSVYLPEHRGHGKSVQKLVQNGQEILNCQDCVHIDSYKQYVEDLYRFIKWNIILKRKKLVLFAHSMGGAIGALFLEQHPGIFDAAILSSPMFGMKTLEYPRIVARIGSEWNCRIGRGTQKVAGKSTYSWVRASLNATNELIKRKNLQEINVPVLILQAGKDERVRNKEQMKFFLRTKRSSIMNFPEEGHELYRMNGETRKKYDTQIFEYLTEICEKDGAREQLEVEGKQLEIQKNVIGEREIEKVTQIYEGLLSI